MIDRVHVLVWLRQRGDLAATVVLALPGLIGLEGEILGLHAGARALFQHAVHPLLLRFHLQAACGKAAPSNPLFVLYVLRTEIYS